MSITAIIQSYRRQENIPFIIKALRNQSVKPTRIIVWNDNDGLGKDLHNLGTDVEIINTNTNYNGNYGSFLFAYLADTKYIAIIDDDYVPAKDWFKFCVECQKEYPGIYGRFGIILTRNEYAGRKHMKAGIGTRVKFTKVDMVGHSYFFPKEAILPMFSVRPPAWLNNVDLHFSFMARKDGWNLYVPTAIKHLEQLPEDKKVKLPFGDKEKSMYMQEGHLERRNDYIKWAIRNKIINEVIPGLKYLNLGCGYRKFDDCINIDCREECNPDLVCDIKELPYKPNSIDGIYAIDVLEHIPRNLVFSTLKSWYKILKRGSFLVVVLPNVRKIAEKYISGKIDCNEFTRLIYANQEKNEFPNFHKSGFDKGTLTKLLKDMGFKKLKNDTKIKYNDNNMLLKFKK